MAEERSLKAYKKQFNRLNPVGLPAMGARIGRITGNILEWSAHTMRAGARSWRKSSLQRRYRPPQVEEWTQHGSSLPLQLPPPLFHGDRLPYWPLSCLTGWGCGGPLSAVLLSDRFSKWGWGEGSAATSNRVTWFKNSDNNHFGEPHHRPCSLTAKGCARLELSYRQQWLTNSQFLFYFVHNKARRNIAFITDLPLFSQYSFLATEKRQEEGYFLIQLVMVESITKHLQLEKEEEESPKLSRKIWIEGLENT